MMGPKQNPWLFAFPPLRGNRFVMVVVGLLSMFLAISQVVSAAPIHQTVPPIKPTATPTKPPLATPTVVKPDKDDDDDDDSQSPPTPTAAAQSGAAAPAQKLMGVITVERLNVREGPGTTFPIAGVVLVNERVQVLERNLPNSWWRICCATGTTVEGWVNAQFVKPDFEVAQAAQLIPLAGAVAASPAASAASASAITTPTVTLDLVIQQEPAYVWQGQEFALVFALTNPGATPVTNVELRDQLPPELTFVAVDEAGGGRVEEQTGEEGRFVLSVRWPQLAASESVEVRLRVQVTTALADGSVLDNLAVVVGDQASAYTAGITIGMPPTSLPDFQ
jgi:uncharacterized repeat protein (TIGR01451 family)